MNSSQIDEQYEKFAEWSKRLTVAEEAWTALRNDAQDTMRQMNEIGAAHSIREVQRLADRIWVEANNAKSLADTQLNLIWQEADQYNKELAEFEAGI